MVGCPEPEELTQLASAGGEGVARAAIADHAASCEGCHAALEALLSGDLAETAAEPEASSAPSDVPTKIDRYRIKRRLGSGAMGIVYVAHDPELDRDVAIKVLRRGAQAERLRREAKALARLSHPNVVAVHDVGEHDGQIFIAMALVDGLNLRQWLTTPHAAAEILRVLCKAARGIAAAHAAGLVHRDLKPDNIFVATHGEVLVGDFGLARDASDGEPDATGEPVTNPTELTLTGTVLGTPAYMAPEQAAGAATEQSDQFSFCVTAYEALYGTRPFGGATFEDLLDSVERGVIARPERTPKIAAIVDRALRRGLRAAPEERFPTMTELIAAIEPPPRRWPYAVGAAVALVGAITTTALVIGTKQEVADPNETCRPTESMLADVWNAARRADLATALRSRSHTADAITELDRQLDAYATRWTTARRDACLAEVANTTAPQQLAGRRACLETRKAAFDVQVTNLIDQDDDVFANWKRVTSLPPVEVCASDDVSLSTSGTAEHQALMRALAVAITKNRAAVAVVSEQAKLARDPAAQLEIGFTEATLALDEGALVEADAALARVRALAESIGAPSTRVRAFALSARSLCLQNRNTDATTFLTMAEAGSARLREHEHAAEIDEVLHARAECQFRQGEHALALPLYLTLVDRVQRRYGRDSIEEYELRTRLGMVYVGLDRLTDAKRESDLWQAIWYRFHPATASSGEQEDGLALEALQRGDLDGAIEHSRRAVEQFAATAGPELPAAHVGLAMLYEVSADSKLSVAGYTQAIDLIPADTKDEELAVKRIEAFDGRGMQRLVLGDVDGAITDFEAAITGGTRWHQAYYVTSSQTGLGRAWVEKREYGRAVRILPRAIATYAKLNNASPFRLATGQFALAQAQWETAALATARATAAQAEVTAALALERAQGMGRRLIPRCTALLASIERWRDTHR